MLDVAEVIGGRTDGMAVSSEIGTVGVGFDEVLEVVVELRKVDGIEEMKMGSVSCSLVAVGRGGSDGNKADLVAASRVGVLFIDPGRLALLSPGDVGLADVGMEPYLPLLLVTSDSVRSRAFGHKAIVPADKKNRPINVSGYAFVSAQCVIIFVESRSRNLMQFMEHI